ncbi:energy transducer TonB [Sphingomonas sp. KRR8]|uniref:energy transducer TonB n=1 Tax=Sphingomonas sp. KRR8 TaxID=2942996 RepID=UPI00202295A0|nr:energy transducer TonB [Sphingomonas sp. KRR8]URD60818.1 energy transducer TonB [Sphingomonas sp. KRR8]
MAVQRLSPLTPRDRAGALAAVVLVQLAILAALIASGRVTLSSGPNTPPIQTFEVRMPAVPHAIPRERPQPKAARPEAEASAVNLRSLATPVSAPKPVVVLPAAPKVIVSDTPMAGAAPTQGAADQPGPGMGAGGTGAGTGAGDGGNGSGQGGGGGIASGPRQIAGAITRRDYPAELRDRDIPYEEVALQYRVGADGYVRGCQVLQSSGSPLLDERTCSLYEQRYRYLPARDASGRPVEITIRAIRSWSLRR